MNLLKKIAIFPFYLALSVVDLSAGIVKKMFTFVSGIYMMLMCAGIIVNLCNKAWSQMIIFIGLTVVGYAAIFLVVILKIFIEELKELCFVKMQ